MSNSDFEKKKVALYEKHLKERGAMASKHDDVIGAHGSKENLPPETADRIQQEIGKMNEKHAEEMKDFFDKHKGYDPDEPSRDKDDHSKEKSKDKDKDIDKED